MKSEIQSEETWDLVIKPKAKWLDIDLAEVWRYRDLMLLFVKRDFIAQYKQTNHTRTHLAFYSTHSYHGDVFTYFYARSAHSHRWG